MPLSIANRSPSKRQQAASLRLPRTGLPSLAQGDVWQQVTIVVVRWQWITAHVTFAALSIVLLVATIANQRISPLRGEAWKSSQLAVLHALDPDTQANMHGILNHKQLLSRDEKPQVRLVRVADDDWRLQTRPEDQTRESEDVSSH